MHNKHSAIDLAHGLRLDRRPGLADLTQQVFALGEVVGRADTARTNQATH